MIKQNEIKIDCLIFQKQEPGINILTDGINRAGEVKEKALYAKQLQKEVDVLLSCSDYDDRILNCRNCRLIANLRRRTADLITRTEKIE